MSKTTDIQEKTRQLLASGQVSCVIGYEMGSRGRTRPAFIYQSDDVGRLVWNRSCTHNLVPYVSEKLQSIEKNKPAEDTETAQKQVAVVVKPCDSRVINVLTAEKQFSRDQVYVIGVACEGIVEGAGFGRGDDGNLQVRCQRCSEREPVVYDIMIGEPQEVEAIDDYSDLDRLTGLTPDQRVEFWLSQFDRCIRCYACRQVCPMCNCPTCLYERDDSLWVGMAIRLNEKRTFHLGRGYHLAGRCVGCNECERVCPMKIPISLLNRMLEREVEAAFGYRAGIAAAPSPLVTILESEDGISWT